MPVGARAVFFDVGGTLMEVSSSVGEIYASACRRLGASVEGADVQKAFERAWVAMSADVPAGSNRYELAPGGEEAWWGRISSMAFDLCAVPAGQRPPIAQLRDVFAQPSAWRVYPEAVESIEALVSAGLRLGVISNWDSRLPALLARLGLDGHFEAVICSAQVGCEKPDRRIFETALRALGVRPDEALHIGDRAEEDYHGARAAGLRALALDRSSNGAALREAVARGGDDGDVVTDLRQAVARILG
jgi:putative hydrolase of the HAD superfamily